jgi:muskelin
MCGEGSPVKALQFLQTQVSSVVDHGDAEEAETFRSLLTHLLAAPSSPPFASSGKKRSREDADESGNGEDTEMADAQADTPVMGGGLGKERERESMKQRMDVFESLLGLINATAKEPSTDLLDLMERDAAEGWS